MSWRVGFLLEAVIIAVVLSGIGLVRDAPYTGPRSVDLVGAILSVLGMGGVVLGILVWQEGGKYVGLLIAVELSRWQRWPTGWCAVRAADADRSGSVQDQDVQVRHLRPDAPADRPRRGDDRTADLSADGAGVQRHAGGPVLAPLSLSMFAVALLAGKKSGDRLPSSIIRAGSRCSPQDCGAARRAAS